MPLTRLRAETHTSISSNRLSLLMHNKRVSSQMSQNKISNLESRISNPHLTAPMHEPKL
jgi:hypothetical protein